MVGEKINFPDFPEEPETKRDALFPCVVRYAMDFPSGDHEAPMVVSGRNTVCVEVATIVTKVFSVSLSRYEIILLSLVTGCHATASMLRMVRFEICVMFSPLKSADSALPPART